MNIPRTVVVIGGGIIGLAVTERLAKMGASVTLLEKENRLAAHQTGHNSGVIHAGPYYVPGSLKAALCAAGNSSMVAFAREHNIPHKVCGKLIVAVTQDEIPRLDMLYERAIANGTKASLITAEEAREYEPHVSSVKALRIGSTGIIDYSVVSSTLASLAEKDGADLILSAQVKEIQTSTNGVKVTHSHGEVAAELLINCAGLQSDRIAAMAGLAPKVQIIPFRGEYYELTESARDLVKGLIYPVPNPALPFLGVHLTRMIDGGVHAGPNAILALAREGYRWNEVNFKDSLETLAFPGFIRLAQKNVATGAQEIYRSLSKKLFASDLARLVPEIKKKDIVKSEAGVRAQAVTRSGSIVDDFIIQQTNRQIHVLNAPSPAATSSFEIAKHIVAKIKDMVA